MTRSRGSSVPPETRAYRAPPVDSASVDLPPRLVPLIEQLAELNHEVWAAHRQEEGWEYGERRDDVQKQHPGLVPYQELSEGEKEYDRKAVISAVRGMLALGYRILPPELAVAADAGGPSATLAATPAFIAGAGVRDLVRLWQEHDATAWRAAPNMYTALASRFITRGEPLLAFEVIVEGLSLWPRSERLRHLMGLALARTGAVEKANAIAQDLRREVVDPVLAEEALGLLGRTHKDLALASPSAQDRRRHLALALGAYAEAAQRGGGYYAAINAATMALLLGDQAMASSLAGDARSRAMGALRKGGAEDYWALATLGEAALVVGEDAEAERRYREAVELAGRGYGEIASMRRQARMIVSHRPGGGVPSIETLFPIPRVAVFAGQMMDDASDVTRSCFPPAAVRRVGQVLRERLRTLHVGFGYASAACGADIAFLESLHEIGGETYVVLPYPREQFAATTVAFGGEEWIRRFDGVLTRAVEVMTASGSQFSRDALLQEYGDVLLLGLAQMHSCALETELILMAVWDGGESPRGVATTVRTWERCGYSVEVIPLPTAGRPEEAEDDDDT